MANQPLNLRSGFLKNRKALDCSLTDFSDKLVDMWLILRKLMVSALLVILPMQGIAAAVASMPETCHSTSEETAVVTMTTADTNQAFSSDNSNTPDEYNGHLCCHHPVGALNNNLLVNFPQPPSCYLMSMSPGSLPDFKESQFRPPRA